MDRQEGQASRSTKGGRRRRGFAKPSASVPGISMAVQFSSGNPSSVMDLEHL
jgi:hypothetical protein